MRYLTGRPKIAGDNLVVGSGVFLYCRMAFWNVSMLMSRSGCLMVLTPISALQLLCGKVMELRRWCTPQSRAVGATTTKAIQVFSSMGMAALAHA